MEQTHLRRDSHTVIASCIHQPTVGGAVPVRRLASICQGRLGRWRAILSLPRPRAHYGPRPSCRGPFSPPVCSGLVCGRHDTPRPGPFVLGARPAGPSSTLVSVSPSSRAQARERSSHLHDSLNSTARPRPRLSGRGPFPACQGAGGRAIGSSCTRAREAPGSHRSLESIGRERSRFKANRWSLPHLTPACSSAGMLERLSLPLGLWQSERYCTFGSKAKSR